MRITFILLGLFFLPFVTHASITPSISPSRTTGVAPLSVFFDASGTTASSTTLPFHELDYSWNFGDDDTATWTYGARPGVNKKNRAYGPVTAHVFEPTSFPDDCSGIPCKIFTVTLAVFDGTDTETITQVISVTNPDDTPGTPVIPGVFTGTKTICISATTLPAAGVGGCPVGASVVQQSNFSTAIDTYIATGKRLLFKRGDTFTTATTAYLDQDGPWTVGAYGSGAKPIVRSTLATDASLGVYGGILVIRSGSGGVFLDDARIMDIAINANDGAGSIVGKGTTAISGGLGTFTKITYLRVDISDLNNAFSFSTSHLSTTLDTMWDENTIQDSTVYNLINQGGNGMYVMGKRMAILGNSIDNNGGGEHNFRSMYWNKLVVSNNTFKNPNTTKANISLRSQYDGAVTSFLPANSWSEYAVVSDNEMTGTGASISVATFNDQGFDRRSRDVIFERNWWHDQPGSTFALSIGSSDLTTARNNVVNQGGKCISSATSNNPNYFFGSHWIYNNTCYSTSLGDAWGESIAMQVYANVGAVNFSNNLVYYPNVTNVVYMPLVDVSAGPITSSNNSTSLQARTINPFPVSTPSTLSNFIPTTGSYALASGTSVPVYRDFYNNLRGATMDMGAFKQDSDPNDTTPPILTESSAIATSTDTTPDYTFSTTEGGSLTYGGDCTSATTTATSGSNTITFSALSVGTHSNCTLTVTDASTNASTPLAITSFTITAPTVTTTSSSSSSSSSNKSKKKKKKISSKITYKQGERVAPYITLLTPKKGSLTNKNFSIKASSSDKSGIQAMFVSINGTKKKRVNNIGSILYTAKKRQNASITVSAYDTLGNVKIAQITITDGKVSGVRYY